MFVVFCSHTRDGKLPRLLRECVGSVRCVAAMLVHVSPASAHYQETLATIQLASRVHRLRRRRIKVCIAPPSSPSPPAAGALELMSLVDLNVSDDYSLLNISIQLCNHIIDLNNHWSDMGIELTSWACTRAVVPSVQSLELVGRTTNLRLARSAFDPR